MTRSARNLKRTRTRRAREREEGTYVDANGQIHDPKKFYDDWSLNGEFGEGDDTKALDVSISMSQPLSGVSWKEISEKGAVRVKNPGSYGPITAICSDMEDGDALAPLKWFVEKKVKVVGHDTQANDHPLATAIGPQRNGPAPGPIDAVPNSSGMLVAVYADTDSSGIYEAQLSRTDGSVELRRFAVNVDPAESDLSPLDPTELAAEVAGHTGSSVAAAAPRELTAAEQEQRQALWWYVLVAGLLVLVAESFVANRRPRLG